MNCKLIAFKKAIIILLLVIFVPAMVIARAFSLQTGTALNNVNWLDRLYSAPDNDFSVRCIKNKLADKEHSFTGEIRKGTSINSNSQLDSGTILHSDTKNLRVPVFFSMPYPANAPGFSKEWEPVAKGHVDYPFVDDYTGVQLENDSIPSKWYLYMPETGKMDMDMYLVTLGCNPLLTFNTVERFQKVWINVYNSEIKYVLLQYSHNWDFCLITMAYSPSYKRESRNPEVVSFELFKREIGSLRAFRYSASFGISPMPDNKHLTIDWMSESYNVLEIDPLLAGISSSNELFNREYVFEMVGK